MVSTGSTRSSATEPVRVSVVLATYNGERFLAEQLDSLVAQSRLPDEVIVVDDGSADATPEILRRFAADAPFEVDLLLRTTHLGTWATFEEGMRRATGDVLVICDQDDRWREHKLAVLVGRLELRPDALLAFSDADLINAEGRLIGRSRWRVAGFPPRQVQRFTTDPLGSLLARQAVSGCTLALRAELLGALLPFPGDIHPGLPVMMYDRWISLLAAAAGAVVTVPEKLVEYRIHRFQQIGIPALRIRKFVPRLALVGAQFIHPRDEVVRRLDYHLAHLEEIGKRLDAAALTTPAAAASLDAASRHLRVRIGLDPLRRRRVAPVVRELVRRDSYRRFSLGAASALADAVR